MKYSLLALCLFSAFSFSQSIVVESVSEHQKLPINQEYMNGAPFGFQEYVECKGDYKFVVIKSAFTENLEVDANQIHITTTDGKDHYPVGFVHSNGIPSLPYTGISREKLKGKQSPIFVFKKNESAKLLFIKDEKFDLPKLSKNVEFSLILPSVKVLGTRYEKSFSMDYTLAESNKDWIKDQVKSFEWGVTPANGELLAVDVEFTDLERGELREFSLYDEDGFVSYALRSAHFDYGGGSTKNYFGSLSSGKYSLIFIAPKKTKKFYLNFRNKKIADVNIQ